MKTLLLLRHAKSSWSNPDQADHDRSLNDRGKRDAPRMGQLIAEQNLVPDVVVTSTAKRARKTAAVVGLACGFAGEIQEDSDLYHATPSVLIATFQSLPTSAGIVLGVAHNPGLEELVRLLTAEDEAMPTAALAQIELELDGWSDLNAQSRGRLVNFWRPRELD